MKTPSPFAAAGTSPLGTLSDQVVNERNIAQSMDSAQRHVGSLTSSIVQLLLRSTPVTNTTPGS